MKIYTSYFSNAQTLRSYKITPVGISLYPPKWYQGQNLKELAPTRELFALSSLPDSVYVPKFRRDVLGKINVKALVEKLEQIGGGGDVALCCFEKDRKGCHRDIVAKWLEEKTGNDVEEFDSEKEKQYGESKGK